MSIRYNTTEEHLRLPAYGRMVQNMVNEAIQIEDPQERQAKAETIVRVMGTLVPEIKVSPNYKQTLWNHLAYMSNYQLDVQYPCDIEKEDQTLKPHKLSYPGHRIRFRHYGHLVEEALNTLKTITDDEPRRQQLIRLAALRMKRNLADWKGDGIEDDKVARDIALYTDGTVTVEETLEQLKEVQAILRATTPKRFNGAGFRGRGGFYR